MYGLDAEMIKKLIGTALSKGGEYADLFAEYYINNLLRLEEGIIKDASKTIAAGVGIRVLKGDQTGYAYVEDITFENLNRAALTAAAIADQPKKVGEIKIVSSEMKPTLYPIKLPISEVGWDRKTGMIKEAEAKAFEVDKRIIRVNVSFTDTDRYILLANSDGVLMTDFQPMMRFGVNSIAMENGNMQSGYQGGGGRIGMEYFKEDKSYLQIAEDSAKDAILLLSAQDAPAGPMPVVLAAGNSGILLHEAIGHPLEADFNRKGTSAYAGRIGQKVASELCTIYDGGNVPNDRGSINFDDEGAVSRKTVLIEKGILRGYMHDRISAAFYKTSPTGNGRRESYQYYPIPRMTVTYLENGTTPPEDVYKDVKQGIYCRSFSGGQVDISNGDFVFNPTVAYLIENGKLTHPVKNFTLIGNGPDVLTKVVSVGNDFRFSDGIWTCGKGQSVPVGVGLPTVLISEITVGGKKA
ncbi:MAG: metalloprotease TldD [Candidatus Delongbacteria bacterium]|nr:metalloprotease TldD [Candidatus Delongbacteria bacterium]